MRVQTPGGEARIAYALGDDRVQPVDQQSLAAIIGGAAWKKEGDPLVLSDVRILAPLTPGKIICVGLNYRDHCRETNLPEPKVPVLFAKFSNTVAAHGEPIMWPAGTTDQVDFEAELGVIIGRRTKGVSREQAIDHVFGYVAVNDVSARDIQIPDGQWVRGKSLDGFCPFGPAVVTPDEVGDVQTLGIQCFVNGTALQDSNTSEMIFPVDYLVSFISKTTTLEPGDLIITGTPHGVGIARSPQIFLKPGDRVEVVIERIGHLENLIAGPVA
jgi:2-keto-4-pentenoate hydratase/2-oxohepta-3-ene-1,7-dioic acid hydratase in catechol pathway